MDRHAIMIPTYGKRENVVLLFEEILDLGLGSQVIIVDDSSPDGAGESADKLAARNAGIQIIHRPGKLGLGTAHTAGMTAVLADGARTLPGEGTLHCSIRRKALSQGAGLFARTALSLQAGTRGGGDGIPPLRCC